MPPDHVDDVDFVRMRHGANKPKPDHVDDVDFERMVAAQANARAADSQLTMAMLAVRVAEYEQAAVRAKLTALQEQLDARYQLGAEDHVDEGAGHKIKRAK